MRRRYAELRRRGHHLDLHSFTRPGDLTLRPDLERHVLRRRAVLDAVSLTPYPVNSRRAGPALVRRVYGAADAVIVEGLQSARDVLGLPAALRARTIVRVHNVESAYHAQMARGAGLLRRAAHRVTAAQYAAYERRAARALPVFAHISEDECRDSQRAHPAARHVLWPPLASPLGGPPPTPTTAPFAGVLLMGDLSIPGNRAGAEWFTRAVFPTLRGARPDLMLHAVGLGSDTLGGPGVRAHGYVPDLAAVLGAGPLLSVLPVAFGGGVKIKTIDTLVSGLPAVASTVAAQGLSGDAATVLHTFEALDTDGATRACGAALDDPAGAWARAAAGEAYARRTYGEAAQTAALAALGLDDPQPDRAVRAEVGA